MKRFISSGAVLLVVAAVISLVGIRSSSAVSLTFDPPAITISPSIGLITNQQVTIHGTGFAPGQASLEALECTQTATSTAGCSALSVPLSVTTAGQFTSTFTVTTGVIGNGTCGTTSTDAACQIFILSTASNSIVSFASIAFASGPGVALTPSTNLRNGESVTITGADFTPGDTVYALECLTKDTSEATCQTGTATPIKVSSSGTLPPTAFQVVTGSVGNGMCGTSPTNYARCLIEVANIKQGDADGATLDFSISLAPTATHVSGYAVSGRTVNVAVLGKNFSAGPMVVGPNGTEVTVVSDTTTRLVLKVKETGSVKKGTYRLTVEFANGSKTSIAYNVR
jgi:hypothetical protein